MKTYNEIYMEVRKKLASIGVDAAALEARVLICYATGKTHEEFVATRSIYPTKESMNAIYALLDRRLSGEPLAYIISGWEFYGYPIIVNTNVLIPRVDTELLVTVGKEFMKTRNDGVDSRILDLCTGSGCVGIALALETKADKVVLVDMSREALNVAKENVKLHKLNDKATCVLDDVTAPKWTNLGNFDLIVSNPPYINETDFEQLDIGVSEFEPKGALYGGKDGMDFYEPIIDIWKKFIKLGGMLAFECGYDQAEKLFDLMKKHGFIDIKIHKDTNQIDRVVSGILK